MRTRTAGTRKRCQKTKIRVTIRCIPGAMPDPEQCAELLRAWLRPIEGFKAGEGRPAVEPVAAGA